MYILLQTNICKISCKISRKINHER